MSETAAEYTIPTETETMDCITQARHNFVLAFQYCWNGKEFPVFREISVNEFEQIHTGYCAIDLLDEALNLHPDFQEARNLRSEIWHAILTENPPNDYNNYLHSQAWTETHQRFFAQVGQLCICGEPATQVHHRTYDNIGNEDILTDLSGLCNDCHTRVSLLEDANRANNPRRKYWGTRGKEYWDKFKTYVTENGNQLRFFPEPDLPSIYGIQIDRKTRKSEDRYKIGAFWLIAYRDRKTLQATLCMQSFTHYNRLKEQKDTIKGQFGDTLGELKWEDSKKRIGFLDDTVGHVNEADTDQEFPWLHDRLVKLHAVFQLLVGETP